jgi:hypothetical protein
VALQFLLDLLTGNMALVYVPKKGSGPPVTSNVGANAALTLLGP